MLKLEKVRKYYKIPAFRDENNKRISRSKKVILDNIDLNIERGEIVAITGKSGCGKTTLLNVIAGLTPPTHGRVEFNGRRLIYLFDFMPALIRNLRIGFIFQTFQLLNQETVRSNVLLPARILGNTGKATIERMEDLLERVGILPYINTQVGSLSGGQKQRVAIARALINDPYLILGDEPTANLDKATSNEIFNILKKLADKEDKAILIVTHKEYMLKRAGRIYNMIDGRLEAKS